MGKQKIIRNGNSLVVTIPSQFVKSVGIKAGQEVLAKIEPETGRVIYSFSGTKQLSLSSSFIGRKKA